MNTEAAAELMLKTKKSYTAADLGSEFGVSARRASGWLYNIRTTPKYKVEETKLPNRRVKLISISGRTLSMDALQNYCLLFPRPSLLVSEASL